MKIDCWELVDERSDEYRREVYGTVIGTTGTLPIRDCPTRFWPSSPLSVSVMIDEMNRRIAGACAVPLRILDPVAWRTHRGAQRVARRVRMARKRRRGWA